MQPKKLYLDSETCGLFGMPVLLQYAIEDGPIELYDIWYKPVKETLQLIEWMLGYTIVGFNLVFDFFMLVKLYTVFRLCDPNWIPIEHIDEIALLEPEAQDGPCIKPVGALDLLLHSRKGPMQALMGRDNVRIKRVPTVLADVLAVELEHRVQIDNIFFARSFDPEAPKWRVFDRCDRFGDLDPDFKDVVLRFNPAGGLKFLAEHVLKRKPKYHYKDVEPGVRPKEVGYAPTALAMSTLEDEWRVYEKGKDGKPRHTGYAWPGVIREVIEHWATHEDARDYATYDVIYLRDLDKHFGYPEPNDNDSILTCMVAAVRWHGFAIDKDGVRKLLDSALAIIEASPININKPSEVRTYITYAMDSMERVILEDSTKKTNLEAIGTWEIIEPEPCSRCIEMPGEYCSRCGGLGTLMPGPHPAASRAKEVLRVKIAAKEVELYNKLLRAGKFHASFNVIGALSSRMSGTDGLNAQGIKHTKEVRRVFPLAWDGYVLSIGDFAAFEVTIADAVCDDIDLRTELMSMVPCHKCGATGFKPCEACKKEHKKPHLDCQKCGNGQLGSCAECDGAGETQTKIHALFGMALFPGQSYEQIRATDGTENDLYTKGKQGFFGSILYGGNHQTLMNKLGVKEDDAIAAIEAFGRRYKGVARWRQRVADSFCSMRQPGGIGTRVIWVDPADYAVTMLGFRRYFTLENIISKCLFDLANKPPPHWKKIGSMIKVCRRDRVQTAGGAVQSALYGAAFAMQAANMRAAANHEIQSPGAEITKAVQRRIWDLQPAGVHEFLVAPMNVHDEVICVNQPCMTDRVAEAVTVSVESFRDKVPLIGMDWVKKASNWADKKGVDDENNMVIISYKR